MKNILTVAITAFLSISFACKAEVAVIVHPSNNNALDENAIKRIFLGKNKKFDNGNKIIPMNQNQGSSARTEFGKKVLGKSDSQLKAYWSKLIFTGKGTPPSEKSNDAEILKLVASTPDSIAYVDTASLDDTVKVVGKF